MTTGHTRYDQAAHRRLDIIMLLVQQEVAGQSRLQLVKELLILAEAHGYWGLTNVLLSA
jgi:hypothetical protein